MAWSHSKERLGILIVLGGKGEVVRFQEGWIRSRDEDKVGTTLGGLAITGQREPHNEN